MEINKKQEEIFHDEWASSIKPEEVLVIENFESVTTPENKQLMKWAGDLKGKELLDLGAGAGEAAVYFAIKGANVTATDLSSGMLKVVEKVASINNTRLKTKQCSADELPFEDNSFDVVHGANLLHHVDINKTLKEVARVLKPSGQALFWDPVDHNPVINIYRRMATEVRTVDEHPIKMSDLNTFRKYFDIVQFKCFWLTTLIIFIKFYFLDRVNPNEERYWKKIITDADKLEGIYLFFEKIDNFILKNFPFLQRYCWNIAISCRNKKLNDN